MGLLFPVSNLDVFSLHGHEQKFCSSIISEVWLERVESTVNTSASLTSYIFANRIIVYSSNVLAKTLERLLLLKYLII